MADMGAPKNNKSKRFMYDIFLTKPGWVGIAGSSKGISRVTLPQGCLADARAELGLNDGHAQDKEAFESLKSGLISFLKGERINFNEELDMSSATEFQRRVWEETRKIPYGRTISYSELAEKIGKPKAVRAVGSALGANPFPMVVPCHRVISKDGSLGGFSGGIERKAQLLTIEKRS